MGEWYIDGEQPESDEFDLDLVHGHLARRLDSIEKKLDKLMQAEDVEGKLATQSIKDQGTPAMFVDTSAIRDYFGRSE